MADPEQKYRIIEKLDAGGMAEIYSAEAELIQGLKKKVAIKRILPHLTRNKKFVAMFLDEARLSLYLDHANIVHVFDIGRSGQTYFIVMEFVDGVNLRTLAKTLRRQRRPLHMEEAIYLMMEVCKGLAYAHDMVSPEDGRALSIVHRDVSPPNILVSRNGEVKLVDFGLAKAASQLEQTDPGVVKGKFSYLSPEAASGREVDHRADIFATGILLFELLTDRRLFYGENDYQTVELVRRAQIPSMRAINPEIPPDLEGVVLRALARNPADRFQYAYDLQEALAQILFDRGLKVTSRDVAKLVQQCVAKRKRETVHDRTRGVINTLIQEEIVKFTSLDSSDFDTGTGAQPLSPEDLGGGSGPLDPRDFVDPRDWTSEFATVEAAVDEPVASVVEVASLERVLEGESTANGTEDIEAALPRQKKSSTVVPLMVGLVVFLVLGAATIFVLHHFGIIGLWTG
jgi:serine/threonine protein kinase